MGNSSQMIEPHYTIKQLSEVYRIGYYKARELFVNQAGVVSVPGKRPTYRIPQSVVLRVMGTQQEGKS